MEEGRKVLETPAAFAKRTGLSDEMVRMLVKHGKIPHLKCGKTRIKIHIEAALEAVKNLSVETADEAADRRPYMPQVVRQRPPRQKDKRRTGRPPDSIRLAQQGQN